MPTFEYKARTSDGNPVNGVVFGQSLDQVLKDLRGQGVDVTQIGLASGADLPASGAAIQTPKEGVEKPAGGAYVYDGPGFESDDRRDEITKNRSYVATSVVGPIAGKIALSRLAFFFRQLSTMVRAGVPIVQCLDTLSRQAGDPRLRKIISELREHANAGRPMSAGMQRYPEVFSPIMLSLVRSGEEAGFLDSSLGIVADYLDDEIEVRNIYRRVTFLPKLELVASVVIILGTNAIIASLGKTGGLSSPLTTPSTWIWLGPLIVAIFLFLRVGLANPRVKYNWDLFVSLIPYIGGTNRQFAMARFGRAFGALYRGGVPINRALALSADACGNEYLRSKMYPAIRTLETGAGIAETLRSTKAFSPIVLDMIQTGETTGNLDQMLGNVADFYQDEGKTRATQTGYVVGVLVALCVMVYIGYIIITFYMGYYGNMMSGIGE